jgi:ElaB/YqjD/DUF883 family membrane-anchored ribosome-binding protein
MSGEPPALPRVDPAVEQSRELAARLLDAFARKLRRHDAILSGAGGLERAPHHGPAGSARGVAAGLGRFIREKPAAALSIAMAAGFLMGQALRRRVFR